MSYMKKISFRNLARQILKSWKKRDTAVLYCKKFSEDYPISLQIRDGLKHCRTYWLRIEKIFVDYRINRNKAFWECYKLIQVKHIKNFVSCFSKKGIPEVGIELLEKVMKGKYKVDITIL